MSTLRVSTLQDTTGNNGSTPAAIANGIAKAWVNFNGTGTTGTSQTIRASYNVSSVYKGGTGDYTVNFITPLADANYSASVIARRPDNLLTGSWFVQIQNSSQMSASAFGCAVIYNPYSSPSIATDSPGVYVAIFR